MPTMLFSMIFVAALASIILAGQASDTVADPGIAGMLLQAAETMARMAGNGAGMIPGIAGAAPDSTGTTGCMLYPGVCMLAHMAGAYHG